VAADLKDETWPFLQLSFMYDFVLAVFDAGQK
jgi:hypothetical protein